jgi:hypothetical protein
MGLMSTDERGYVFLGPTLAAGRARAELDAVCLPPVSEGDIYRLWGRRPRAIGIVDGYFERVPAVWHKEIMWIMERGVHVFGAASMGALRAVELDSFGMRGVGWVYQQFRDGMLDRDDEVAVKHGAAGEGYRALSEAMVNVRRTLQAAEHQGIISAATRDALSIAGTVLFYRDRIWPELLTPGRAAGADAAEIDALRQWLPAGRIDQQADDAVAMLREMGGFLATDPAPQQVNWTMANAARWESAKRRAGTMSPDGTAGFTSMLESILDEIRLLGPGAFEAARDRRLLRFFAADFAEHAGIMIGEERRQDAVAEFRVSNGLSRGADLARFLHANDLPADGFERLVVADEMARWAFQQAEWDGIGNLLDDPRIRGNYASVLARAKGKLDLQKLGTGQETAPGDVAASRTAALRWYFAEKRGATVPEDLAAYAQSCGFPNEQAFRKAVRLEYRYVCGR